MDSDLTSKKTYLNRSSLVQEHLAPEAAQALVCSDALFVEVARGDEVEGAVQDALFNLIAPLGRFDVAKEVQVRQSYLN